VRGESEGVLSMCCSLTTHWQWNALLSELVVWKLGYWREEGGEIETLVLKVLIESIDTLQPPQFASTSMWKEFGSDPFFRFWLLWTQVVSTSFCVQIHPNETRFL
jgi:hypothetical protein